jgi:4-hydroxybenzoate polyprenyltransferase/phosphoserine phosphatase
VAANVMQNQVRDPSVISPAPVAADSAVPVCTDLDGTLVKSNMLMETLVAVVRRRPWLAPAVPFWFARGGRAGLKRGLASRAVIDYATLPYDENLLADLRREHARGRKIVLSTAADSIVATRIADHLGIFHAVIASDGKDNMKGKVKAAELVRRFGERGYDFVGEDRFDFPAWSHARSAIVVGSNRAVLRRIDAMGLPRRSIERSFNPVLATLRGMRVYQWAKNLLVFVPLLTAHRFLDGESLAAALLAFLAFSLVASAVYLANDLADLEDDRPHPAKRRRALASGDLAIGGALLLAPALLAGAAWIALLLPWEFGALLGAYVATNFFYSSGLKRIAVLDVFVLAGLYTLRILAGAAAIDVPVSHWLLAFSSFAFLSIALVKRYVEVANVASRDELRVGGRGYLAHDGPLLAALGTAAGYLSVLVFALYITSPRVMELYSRPAVLWFAVPLLLYWISRIWFLAHRGRLHEDPLLFALRDGASYATGAAILLVMFAAT